MSCEIERRCSPPCSGLCAFSASVSSSPSTQWLHQTTTLSSTISSRRREMSRRYALWQVHWRNCWTGDATIPSVWRHDDKVRESGVHGHGGRCADESRLLRGSANADEHRRHQPLGTALRTPGAAQRLDAADVEGRGRGLGGRWWLPDVPREKDDVR